MQNTAQILLAYHLTHSVFDIGLLACAQFLCPLLLGSWAGTLTARIGTKRTLIGCQLLSAAVAGALAGAEWARFLTLRELIAAALVTGLFFTFTAPAQSVMAPVLAPTEDTQAPIAMNSVSYNAGRTVAPAVSVLVVAVMGFGWAFAFNAISFGVYAVLLTACRTPADPGQPERSRFLDGFRSARLEPRIIVLLLMVTAITVADDPVLVLGPALARNVFGTSADWSGYFLSALGAGSVVGSLLPRWRVQSGRRAAAALALLGVSMVAFALAPYAEVSLIAAFAAGTACLVAGSAAQALLHDIGHRQGPGGAAHVMGLWLVAWAGSKPLASLTDGVLASHLGIRLTGLILATPAFIPALVLLFCPEKAVSWLVRPRVRREGFRDQHALRRLRTTPRAGLRSGSRVPVQVAIQLRWPRRLRNSAGVVVHNGDDAYVLAGSERSDVVRMMAAVEKNQMPGMGTDHRARTVDFSPAGRRRVLPEDQFPASATIMVGTE